MKHLQDLCRLQAAEPLPWRRGPAGQRPQRLLERASRQEAVDFTAWVGQRGLSVLDSAACLGLVPRTLRQWRYELAQPGPSLRVLGRPVVRSPRNARMEVLDFLGEYGAGTGLPTLRACFPDLARAELDDLLRRYRRVWRRRYGRLLHVLHWQVVGSVWAMDFAKAPAAIDGRYPYLFAVRDLASGRQLLWLPVQAPTAEVVLLALAPLFVIYGAPLVLKSDNGSAFGAWATLAFLYQAEVIPLFSPAYTPEYNGSIEAGIGSMKGRTEAHASRHGRPGQWTWDDAAAGQEEGNATARPHGERGPTPDELWAGRRVLTTADRNLFQEAVARCRQEVRVEECYPEHGPLPEADQRRLDRKAIRRALEERAYLLYSRRRIPLPITKKKVANIT